jgi:hypothetical protein
MIGVDGMGSELALSGLLDTLSRVIIAPKTADDSTPKIVNVWKESSPEAAERLPPKIRRMKEAESKTPLTTRRSLLDNLPFADSLPLWLCLPNPGPFQEGFP